MMRSVLGGIRSFGFVLMILMSAAYAQAVNFSKSIYWYVNGEKQEYLFDEHQLILSAKQDVIEALPDKGTFKHLGLDIYNGTDLVYIDANAIPRVEGDILFPVYEPGSHEPILLDDKLMVTFKDPYISVEQVLEFAAVYDLQWLNPSIADLPKGGTYTHIFKMNSPSSKLNAATLSAILYEQRPDIVHAAQPNRVNHAHVDGSAVVDELTLQKSWHLDNNGQSLFCTQNNGSKGADINAVEAWDMGFTGHGIKVAVIDIGGFDMEHPDMQGQFTNGWDCISNNAYGPGNSYFVDPSLAHGMAVAGIIGAKGNDVGATGVAYNAQIVPLLINGSESSILIALQKALEMDVDVINMSFGTGYSQAVQNQIENLVNLGRSVNGTSLGTIIVASHGNDGQDDDVAPQWPSAYPEVISVSANTPDDSRKVTGDSWNVSSTWATNYGNKLDLSAPGVCIYTTDISGSAGYSSTDYGGLQKTSAAAPIVSGVTALLLSKNVLLTWQEVREKMLEGADKVHSNEYDYQHDSARPGHSREMGYGRVNAGKTLQSVTVGINDHKEVFTDISINNPITNVLTVRYTSQTEQDLQMVVFDMSGKQLETTKLSAGTNRSDIDLSHLAPGMYFAGFIDADNRLMETQKFIKAQ